MFDNIGSKIMKLAKVLCWLGIISSVIAGISTMVTGNRASSYYGTAAAAAVSSAAS